MFKRFFTIAAAFAIVIFVFNNKAYSQGADTEVKLDMQFAKATEVLTQCGAKDITSKVDLKFENPDKSLTVKLAFFELSDGTVLQIYADDANPTKQIIIGSLEMGEKGKGFGASSDEWKKQKKAYPVQVDIKTLVVK